jgi:hypothetical protein
VANGETEKLAYHSNIMRICGCVFISKKCVANDESD